MFIKETTRLKTFTNSIWLLPAAFSCHVLEELTGFTKWVQRNINPQFTQQHYLKVHVFGIIAGFVLVWLITKWKRPLFVFLYLAFFILPGMLYNILFHLGATIYYLEYSPGLITALCLYPSVLWLVLRNTLNERLITEKALVGALIIGAIFHITEVASNVYYFHP